jgi:hypothetical protein
MQMQQILNDVVLFIPASKQVDFSKIATFKFPQLVSIVNQTSGSVIYAPALGAAFGGTFSSGVLTLTYDTTTMNANDVLQIRYNGDMAPGNSPLGFQDGFQTFNANNWEITSQASGDLIRAEGNLLGSSYLTISLDPLAEDTETVITSKKVWTPPVRLGFNVSVSQRALGQECAIQYVCDEAPTALPAPVAISSASQTTTTITINTATPHGFSVGDKVSISDINGDSRANYSNVTVNTVPTSTSFTCTSTASANLPSLTISGITQGYVAFRRPLSGFSDGTAMVIEDTTATNASFYTKSGVGRGSFPSGTIATRHSTGIDTTASVQPVAGMPGGYAFNPSSVYELIHQPESIEWLSKPIDSSTAGYTVRYKKDRCLPDPSKKYKVRFLAKNGKSVTRVTSSIISCSKAASTTSNVQHDGTITYTTGDYVQLYGRRDTTNFANLTTAAIIASVVDQYNFTVIDGVSATATTYGGAIVKVNGSQGVQGMVTQSIQNAVRSSSDGLLVLTGSASWTGILVGDFVNVYGCRDNTTGANVGVDGAYRVYSISTTTLTLESLSGATGDIASVACGGVVVKRTDFRIDLCRAAEFTRNVTECFGGMTRIDQSAAVPVYLTNNQNVTVSNTVSITSNSSVNVNQLAGSTPITHSPNGATNKALTVGISGPLANTDYSAQAWAAASGNGAVIANASGLGLACSFDINVTAWTAGSSTGLVVYLQESPDNGTTFFDIWQTEAITATGHYRIPAIPVNGRRRMRWVNLSGAATTATVTVTAMDLSSAPSKQVQWFDRTAGVGSGTASTNTNSAAYNINGCKAFTVVMQTGTASLNGSFKVQMSMDGTNWYDASAATTIPSTSAGMTIIPVTAGVYGRFLRVQCTAGGTSQLVTAIHIYGCE